MTDFDLSCPDWRDRLAAGLPLVTVAPFDPAAGARAVAIFDKLRLPDVEGRPLLADAAGDWFRDIVRVLFGSYDREQAIRLVCDIFLLVPKKNAKTTYSAALMLVALLINERPDARFGLFGPTQEISDIAFAAAAGMIAADPDLSTICHVKHHLKEITLRAGTGATLKVTTFDPAVATGGKFAGWLLDEAHLLSNVAYASRVLRQLRGARMAIPESFGVIITTQSDVPPAGAFKEELHRARRVRDGVAASNGLLPILYEFPEEVQTDRSRPYLDDENLWRQVLPNLGRGLYLPVMRRDLAAEREKGGAALAVWLSQHLNIELGLALHVDRWKGADFWAGAAYRGSEGLTLETLLERSEVVTIGIDGGGLDDLLSLSVIGREKGGRRWLHWGRAWVDREILKDRPAIASYLEGFERDGDLVFVDIAPSGEGDEAADVSYLDDLRGIVETCFQAGLLPAEVGIGVDPAGIAGVLDVLETIEGLGEGLVVPVRQGWAMSGIQQSVSIRLKAGTFAHAAQSLVAWAVGNAKPELKGNAVLITKQTAGAAKIDPVMSLFDAAELMSRNPKAAKVSSVYEERPLLVL